MQTVPLQFLRPWEVLVPSVIRYLENVYVDAFFEKGSLRLSSFRRFRQHKDEQRGDAGEGSISMEITNPESHHTVVGFNGQEAYVLCGSTIQSLEVMKAFEGAESGIKIKNPVSFADAVSRYIPGFVGGFQGACIYTDDRVVRRSNVSDMKFPPPDDEAGAEKWAEEYERYLAAQNSNESLLLKPLRYAHQAEYRLAWFAAGREKGYIDVECSEAIQFCEKVTFGGRGL
jgi:hypothetical protein